ncbi:J domain-containing protein 1 [Scheffersomyces spartinae]|uniref:J domain-containing protein 1 n=1 Tax=Scheffersomyces spartinae TaxID=45513 RepID=A0A9P8AGN1_9ASCO|nr:J domain-containing protein 1 [Scheffersomyces spartinae]KAG7192535.1 J domain-containing protein 1 [Scheffersomyces spartinae]
MGGFTRQLATAAPNNGTCEDVHHLNFNLPPWPKGKDPTPYEIFHIEESEKKLSTLEFNKLIKTRYMKYVKVYHPDVCKHSEILDRKTGNSFSLERKRQRFDMVVNAYDVLKDPKRRLAYIRYDEALWQNYDPKKHEGTFNAYRQANAHRRQYGFSHDETFWHAATWEDYYRMKHGRAPPSMEELEKNKWKILWGVLAIMTLTGTVQTMWALDRANDYIRTLNLKHSLASEQYELAKDNYGEGDGQLDRVKRFLVNRRANFDDPQFLEARETGDNELLTTYARKRVTKWSDQEDV